MSVSPAEIKNVWAGDSVRFDSPLGNMRRPNRGLYGYLLGCAALGLIGFVPAISSFFTAIAMIAAPLFAIMVVGLELLAWFNRVVARRMLRRPSSEQTYAALAGDCWLRPLARGAIAVRFDAAEWIRRTGPSGPRVVVRDGQLALTPADPNVFEPEPIDTWTERRTTQRTGMWLLIAVWSSLFIQVARAAWLGIPTLNSLIMLVITGFMLVGIGSRLGLLGPRLSTIIAEPGAVRVVRKWRSRSFTREDAVLFLEPMGTSRTVAAQFVTVRGETFDLMFMLGWYDPMLARLISRWCWRNGAAKGFKGVQMLNVEPLPEITHGERH